jgi:hypothetical protein
MRKGKGKLLYPMPCRYHVFTNNTFLTNTFIFTSNREFNVISLVYKEEKVSERKRETK